MMISFGFLGGLLRLGEFAEVSDADAPLSGAEKGSFEIDALI